MVKKFPCGSTVANDTKKVWYVSRLRNSLEAPLWHKKWIWLFKLLKNSHVPLWKALAKSYWIDLQITVDKDDSSGYGMDQ